MTKYAQMILELIERSSAHPSAEDIYRTLRERDERIALATVYNNLNRMCSEGKIRRLTVDGYPDRYDKLIRHDHLICPCCGKLTDASFTDISGDIAKQLGVESVSYDLRVFFLCDECAKKQAEE